MRGENEKDALQLKLTFILESENGNLEVGCLQALQFLPFFHN